MKINNDAIECIKVYVEEVGSNGENIIVNGMGLQKKGQKYHCPNTSQHRNGDKKPSMSWDDKKKMMYCFTCGKSINVYQYYKDYENKKFIDIIPEHIRKDTNKEGKKKVLKKEEKQFFTLNKEDLKPISKKDRKYLNDRGIDDKTIKLFKIVSTQYIYQYDKDTKEYKRVKNEFPAFVYFNNNMEVCGIKYRSGWENCKYVSFPNSDFTLFGRHLVDKNNKELIIVEGEIDCMILKMLFPCRNIVSVPTGANSLEMLFEKEKDFFTNFENIFVCPDNDNAGKTMLMKFEKKFGSKVNHVDFKRYKGLNDISDLYKEYGVDGLKSLIRTSISHDIHDMSEIEIQPEDNYYLDTGYDSLDDALNGIAGGTVTTICGYTGHGKTTFVEAFINKSVGAGYKVLTIDGEHRTTQKVNNTFLKILSDLNKNANRYVEEIKVHRKTKMFPNEEGKRICRAWAKNKNFLYSVADIEPEKRLDNEKLFNLIANAVKYDDISMVVLDNLMSINNEMSEGDQFQKQEKFVKRCQALAKKYSVAVVLVAHMKKPNKEGKVNEYQIFGSSTIPNYMDNIIYVRKANKADIDEYKSNHVKGIIEILKNREESELKEILLTFEPKTKMLYELNIQDLHKPFPILIDFGLKKYMDNEVLEKKEAEKQESFFNQLGLGEI